MKRLRKFLTSFLISVVVFCLPVYADFTSVDSNNLSSIQIYVRSIDTGINNVITSISNISSYFNNLISSVGNLSNSLASYFNSYQSWYLDIIDSIQAISGYHTYPYLQDAIWYISSQYFDVIWTDVNISPGSNGYFDLNDGTYSRLILSGYNGNMSYTLSPGTYIFSFTFYADQKPSYVSVASVKLSDVTITQDWAVSNRYLVVGLLDVNSVLAGRELVIDIGVNFAPGVIYGGLAPYSTDAIAGDAMNPDQAGMVSDVDDAGKQQSQQEDQMWQNINTYKGDISFNLDGWDDAAGGLSYVTGIFMTIWNNSPTQPIVLSLMLGIAMLSIGRGVMAAVRVSRNRGDD